MWELQADLKVCIPVAHNSHSRSSGSFTGSLRATGPTSIILQEKAFYRRELYQNFLYFTYGHLQILKQQNPWRKHLTALKEYLTQKPTSNWKRFSKKPEIWELFQLGTVYFTILSIAQNYTNQKMQFLPTLRGLSTGTVWKSYRVYQWEKWNALHHHPSPPQWIPNLAW